MNATTGYDPLRAAIAESWSVNVCHVAQMLIAIGGEITGDFSSTDTTFMSWCYRLPSHEHRSRRTAAIGSTIKFFEAGETITRSFSLLCPLAHMWDHTKTQKHGKNNYMYCTFYKTCIFTSVWRDTYTCNYLSLPPPTPSFTLSTKLTFSGQPS